MFQSTPPHGGRLFLALTGDMDKMFQSTPPHGGRQSRLRLMMRLFRFQSTPPHGGRPHAYMRWHGRELVSIHAPAWGGDLLCFPEVSNVLSFNPRPRMGGDVESELDGILLWQFQSTPPHRGRRDYIMQEGGELEVSIHAPAWGATQKNGKIMDQYCCFNPRPRMGGDVA